MMSKLQTLAVSAIFGALSLAGCQTFTNPEEAALSREANPGPCPRAFSLYETSRIVEIRGEAETLANVGFTGEIDKVRSLCRYYGSSPISANLELDMRFGRGPAASEESHTYHYFVAVTRKNVDVINKEYFPVTITFPAGVTQMSKTEQIQNIVIPRAKETTSGANFEIITGFDLTPAQLQFNEDGKRFRVNAGG